MERKELLKALELDDSNKWTIERLKKEHQKKILMTGDVQLSKTKPIQASNNKETMIKHAQAISDSLWIDIMKN